MGVANKQLKGSTHRYLCGFSIHNGIQCMFAARFSSGAGVDRASKRGEPSHEYFA